MEHAKYVQDNAVTLVVGIIGVTCAKYFHTIEITFRDLTAFFEKKPDPPVQEIPI